MVHVPLEMSSKSWLMLGSLETISCASLNHCWLLHAGWRQVRQASVTGRAQPTQLILLLASSSLLQGCFGAASWKFPLTEPVSFPLGSSWSASHSGFLWDAPLQNTFLSPAWQSECCPQACAGMLPVCWAAVLASTEWSGSGPLWMPLSPALAVFPAPPAVATSGQLCALNRS